jgi:hypothetical protein
MALSITFKVLERLKEKKNLFEIIFKNSPYWKSCFNEGRR